MKKMKKFASILLALVMAMALTVPAFAEGTEYKITINDTDKGVTVNGNEFKAYKVFDVKMNADSAEDASAFYYTVASEFVGFSYQGMTGDDLVAFVADMTDNSDALNAFAKAAMNYAKENNISAAGIAVGANNVASISVNSPGYYLVAGSGTAPDEQTITAACSLTTVAPTQTITVKADAPSITKKIDDTLKGKVDDVTRDIGTEVKFELTSKVPNMTGYDVYKYIVHDTMTSGLTLNSDSFEVKIGDEVINLAESGTMEKGNYWFSSMNVNGGTSFDLVIPDLTKYEVGSVITITYTATVNSDALQTNHEDNTVYLEYSSNPYDENETKKTPDDVVHVYDFDLVIDKYAKPGVDVEIADAERLAGATFALYKTVTTGAGNEAVSTNLYYAVDAEGKVTWIPENTEGTTADAKVPTGAKKAVTDDNGKVEFQGLAAGTYYLVETAAPDGYNPITAPIVITITEPDYKEGVAANPNDFTVTIDSGSASLEDDFDLPVPVENDTGAQMPETGGIGTTIFYTLGGLMVVAAGVLLVTKRRMQSKG